MTSLRIVSTKSARILRSLRKRMKNSSNWSSTRTIRPVDGRRWTSSSRSWSLLESVLGGLVSRPLPSSSPDGGTFAGNPLGFVVIERR